MSLETTAMVILLGSFLLLLFFRVPIIFSVGISSLLTILYIQVDLQTVVQKIIAGMNSFPLLACPFFMLAGSIMGEGGISKRLIAFSNALVGWIRGGLAMVNVVASMFFGGISGSATADTSSIGPILIPMMVKQGYDIEFATNITMTSSVQGILIPPSHNMVIFATVAGGVSIGRMFLAGVTPGVMLGVALMVYSYYISVKRGYPKGERLAIKKVIKAAMDALWGLVTVFIVVVGVISGAFTATEAAAIAVLWSMFVTFFIYREIPFRRMWKILGDTIATISVVLVLIGISSVFGWLLAYLKIPALITQSLLSLSENPVIIFLIINGMLLFLGMIMDLAAVVLIVTPILLPVVVQLGMDPVHFGIMMILNLGIGLVTPPVGSCLFVGSAISGLRIETLGKSLLPFYLVMLAVLLVVTFCPPLVMTLPDLLMPT